MAELGTEIVCSPLQTRKGAEQRERWEREGRRLPDLWRLPSRSFEKREYVGKVFHLECGVYDMAVQSFQIEYHAKTALSFGGQEDWGDYEISSCVNPFDCLFA